MTQKMRQKLKRGGYRSRYRLGRLRSWSRCSGRSSKHEDFDKFLMRGLEAVQAEWALICTTHNTKLAKAISGRLSQVFTLSRRYLDGLPSFKGLNGIIEQSLQISLTFDHARQGPHRHRQHARNCARADLAVDLESNRTLS